MNACSMHLSSATIARAVAAVMSDATQQAGLQAQSTLEAASSSETVPAAVASTSKVTAEREKKRLALRSGNLAAWQNGPTPPLKGPLDSNMKKNTAFIKRIRQTLGVETKDQLIKESSTLNLDKYIDEVVQAIPEGLSKCTTAKDCFAAAETLSALHARFSTNLFATPLTAFLSPLLSLPSRTVLTSLPQEQREKDELARVQRQKVLLRASAELALVEILRHEKGKAKAVSASEEPDDLPFPGQEWLYTTLREFLVNDRDHANVPILLTLLKALGPSLLGQVRRPDANGQDAAEKLAALSLESVDRIVDAEMQTRFRKLCETYFATLGKRIVKEHARLQEQDKRNHEAYIRSGEIFEDRQQNYEKMTKSFERLHEWGKLLSDFLNVPLPSFTSESKSSGVGLAVNLDARTGTSDRREVEYMPGQSVWEDEDMRRFYVDLVDLAEMVPPALLTGSVAKSKGDEESTNEDKGSSEKRKDAQKGAGSTVGSPQLRQDADESDALQVNERDADAAGGLAAGPAAQLNAFLVGLPELSNRSMIDSAAVEFAFLNSKVARKKLVKQLTSLPRSRSDLIPYYARLTATLSKYMPDIGQGVVALLDDEFRFLQKKRNVDMAESRAKNLRFLGELVKFGITPLITIFHCFKVCLDDFSGPNVENVATLLETCGRYLLRSEGTGERMQSTLELLRRKRAAQNLDARQLVLLDNAYYQCNPPEREATVEKQRTPLERYIGHLIYDVLKRGTPDKVVKQLRKLPWDDAVTRDALCNVFVRSWRIKFSNLHLLAVVLHNLQQYHGDFVVNVIDTVCEQIRVGMETNTFKDNQRRVATLKYLGELYNYRLINSEMIFEQLWSLVSFGHPLGRPLPGQVSPIDAPDDYFRIRLVCTLLDACGMCFDQGVLRKKLDDFLVILNVYLLSKEQPLPMDIDFMLSDTLEVLRPSLKLKQTFEEAALAADAMLAARQAEIAKQEAAAASKLNTAKQADSLPANDHDEEDADSDGESVSTTFSSADEAEEAPRHVSKDDASTDSEDSSDESTDNASGEEEEDVDEDVVGADGGSGEDEEEDMLTRRTGARSAVDQEAEDEFLRDLQKMMAESNQSAQQQAAQNRGQRGLFDIGLPFIKKAQAQAQQQRATNRSTFAHTSTSGNSPLQSGTGAEEDVKDESIGSTTTGGGGGGMGALPPQHMRFSLLSKRGNRQQTHEVHVPMDAALAVHSRANEEQQLAEREQLKRLVLGIETREQAEDRSTYEASVQRRNNRMMRSNNEQGY